MLVSYRDTLRGRKMKAGSIIKDEDGVYIFFAGYCEHCYGKVCFDMEECRKFAEMFKKAKKTNLRVRLARSMLERMVDSS